MDADGDGKLTFEEFVALYVRPPLPLTDPPWALQSLARPTLESPPPSPPRYHGLVGGSFAEFDQQPARDLNRDGGSAYS